MVVCKTFKEYHSNQRKLRRFYLEEQAVRAALTITSRPNPVNRESPGLLGIAKHGKSQSKKTGQKKTKAKPNRKAETKRLTTTGQLPSHKNQRKPL